MLNNFKRVLYISYNGALEEIVPSQVIPYLRELAKEGYKFTLLTFEKKRDLKEIGQYGIAKFWNELSAMDIDWHWLRYHKRISLLATSFDVVVGAIYASYLVVTKRIGIVHARSVVPAAMSIIPTFLGARFIFDTRGLLAEEYVGGGHWKERCLKYRIVKFFEKLCLRLADTIVVLTQRHRDYLLSLDWLMNEKKNVLIEVISSCVDLNRFKYKHTLPEINSLRQKQNLHNNFVFTYLGKTGKHYLFEEMLNFLKIAFEIFPNAKFMILTQDNQRQILDILLRKKFDLDRIIIKKPTFEEIPFLIALAQAGVFFINPYKKFGSSPIKLGEFLSCGIPVIINGNIGDTEELVNKNRIGVVLNRLDDSEYKNALREFLELTKEGEALNKRCRNIAEDYLSLGLGVRKYSAIYKHLHSYKKA